MHNNKSIQSAAPEITWRRSPVAWAAAATMCREEKEEATIDEEEVKQCSLMAAAKHQKQKDVEAGANKHYNCVCANIFFLFLCGMPYGNNAQAQQQRHKRKATMLTQKKKKQKGKI